MEHLTNEIRQEIVNHFTASAKKHTMIIREFFDEEDMIEYLDLTDNKQSIDIDILKMLLCQLKVKCYGTILEEMIEEKSLIKLNKNVQKYLKDKFRFTANHLIDLDILKSKI